MVLVAQEGGAGVLRLEADESRIRREIRERWNGRLEHREDAFRLAPGEHRSGELGHGPGSGYAIPDLGPVDERSIEERLRGGVVPGRAG